MARPSPYDEATRAAIIEAAVAARKDGKKWGEAFSAAQECGYKGGQQYLVKMIRGSVSGVIKSRKRRGKPGRPAKVAGSGLGSIQSIVDSMVEARISTVLDGAIAALEGAAKELKSLR